jgi:hypothetical protein
MQEEEKESIGADLNLTAFYQSSIIAAMNSKRFLFYLEN